MGDLYASAIGTTVLQIKEIPPRPKEFDGALCLFGLAADGVNEAVIRSAFCSFGGIKGVSGTHRTQVESQTLADIAQVNYWVVSTSVCFELFELYSSIMEIATVRKTYLPDVPPTFHKATSCAC